MSNDTKIIVSGYVGGMPDVYDNENGSQTVVFSVGVTSRRFNKEADTWEDEATAWYSVRTYGALAQNVLASVNKGTPVLVRGALKLREWADKDGVKRSRHVIIADRVGIDLATGTATFTKTRPPRQTEIVPENNEPQADWDN